MNPAAHLPDDLLQTCASLAAPAPAAAAHLRNCPQCQARVRHYQALFAALAVAPRPAFGFDLAAAVLAQLPAPAAPRRRLPRVLLLLLLLTVPLLLVAAPVVWFWGYFVGLFQNMALGLVLPTAAALVLLLAGESLLTHRRQLAALRPA